MIHLTSSMAVGCIPCARFYKAIVMAVSGGRIMMQFDEVLNSEIGGCPED
jgi:hypothetical protein